MKLMDIFNELAPNKLFISILLGTLSGGCYAFLIPILLNSFTIEDSVLRVMNEQPYSLAGFEVSDVKFALLFAGLCLCIFLTRTMSHHGQTDHGPDVKATAQVVSTCAKGLSGQP